MLLRGWVLHVVTAAMVSSSALVLAGAPAWAEPSLPTGGGEVLVAVDPGTTASEVARSLGGTVVRSVPGRSDLAVVAAPRGDERDVARQLSSEDAVRWAVPNPVAHIAALPNDPYLRFQWHLAPRGAAAGGSNWVPTFGTGVGGSGVTVAVIDTGVTAHSDLDGVLPGWDAVANDTEASDEHGHGTHVAGTIAETSGNGLGAAGIAPDASILPVRVLDAAGSGTYDRIIAGMGYAVRRGAQVLNLSFSGDVDGGLCDAVDRAVAAGAVVVAAAGNESGAVTYPAACPKAIAVSAVRMNGTAASYTNSGPEVDLAGPGGESVEDTDGDGYPDGILQFSRIGGEPGYYFEAGTSMASPHVAGAAALVRQVNRGLSPAQVRSVLMASAVDLGTPGGDAVYGAGLLDVTAAVARARTESPAPAPVAPAPQPSPAPEPAPAPKEPTPPEPAPAEPTPAEPTGSPASVQRDFGADRFATAANLSHDVWPGGSDQVFVASGRDFADALSTASLAGSGAGPLLLSGRCDLTYATRLELRRLQPQQVTVVGGESALCADVISQITTEAPSATVNRVAGPDRFHTAVEASRAAFPDGADTVVVASGIGFADGLSGGALAAHGRSPLLLVGGCSVPPIVVSELSRLHPTRVTVLGGASAVCDDVVAEIQSLTGASPQRLAGADRFATATMASGSGWPGGSTSVFVAGGSSFPDGLAAGLAAAKLGAPLLLVPSCDVPAEVAGELSRLGAADITVVGGFQSICDRVLTSIEAAARR